MRLALGASGALPSSAGASASGLAAVALGTCTSMCCGAIGASSSTGTGVALGAAGGVLDGALDMTIGRAHSSARRAERGRAAHARAQSRQDKFKNYAADTMRCQLSIAVVELIFVH
jgi:hypothetical protein